MKHLSALAVLIGCATGQLHVEARAACAADWLYGTWRSDPEKSIERMSFQGTVLQGPAKERMKSLFGSHTHKFERRVFAVLIENPDGVAHQIRSQYVVRSCTDSTLTLGFRRTDWPDLVLYKADDCYMIRSQNNFEYFCRAR